MQTYESALQGSDTQTSYTLINDANMLVMMYSKCNFSTLLIVREHITSRMWRLFFKHFPSTITDMI